MRAVRLVLALSLVPSLALAKREHGKPRGEKPPAEETTEIGRAHV